MKQTTKVLRTPNLSNVNRLDWLYAIALASIFYGAHCPWPQPCNSSSSVQQSFSAAFSERS